MHRGFETTVGPTLHQILTDPTSGFGGIENSPGLQGIRVFAARDGLYILS